MVVSGGFRVVVSGGFRGVISGEVVSGRYGRAVGPWQNRRQQGTELCGLDGSAERVQGSC